MFEERFMHSHNNPDYDEHCVNHENTREKLRFILGDPQQRLLLYELESLYSKMFGDLNDDEPYIRYLEKIKLH